MSSSVIQGYSSELPLFFSTSALNSFGSGLSSSPFSNNVSALPEILYGPQRAHSTRVPSPVLIPHSRGLLADWTGISHIWEANPFNQIQCLFVLHRESIVLGLGHDLYFVYISESRRISGNRYVIVNDCSGFHELLLLVSLCGASCLCIETATIYIARFRHQDRCKHPGHDPAHDRLEPMRPNN